MITTPDGVALYTKDEMEALNTKVNEQFKAGLDYGTRIINNDLRGKVIKFFQEQVSMGEMDTDEATRVFNGLAEALRWATVTRVVNFFTVTVSYNGTIIAEFEDVEADDASSAEDEVSSNMEVEDVEVNFALAYNGHTIRGEANMTYDWSDDFEYEANEQD
jgi:hypothetical protein